MAAVTPEGISDHTTPSAVTTFSGREEARFFFFESEEDMNYSSTSDIV